MRSIRFDQIGQKEVIRQRPAAVLSPNPPLVQVPVVPIVGSAKPAAVAPSK